MARCLETLNELGLVHPHMPALRIEVGALRVAMTDLALEFSAIAADLRGR